MRRPSWSIGWNLEVPIPYRAPVFVNATAAAHEKWLKMLDDAEVLVQQDAHLQFLAANGHTLRERNVPPETIGRFYSRFCTMVNNLYDAYMQNVHLQRADYIKEIVTIFVQRMYELRNELQNMLLTDYIYIDSALIENRLIPQDIDIVIPCHIAKEIRDDSTEALLRRMWIGAIKRKEKPARRSTMISRNVNIDKMFTSPKISGEFISLTFQKDEKNEDEDSVELFSEMNVVRAEDQLLSNITLIQKHERYRIFKLALSEKQYHTIQQNEDPELISLSLRMAAAAIIVKVYRQYMFLKREHLKTYKRDIILGIEPDPEKPKLLYDEETNKLYDLKTNVKKDISPKFLDFFEKEKNRLLLCKKDNVMEDITEHIREWFKEWYYGFGQFPEFPTRLERGTVLVVRGDFITVEEQNEQQKLLQEGGKGKSKDQMKSEKQKAKQEAKRKAAEAKIKEKKQKEALLKKRFSPLTDPGYLPCQSDYRDPLIEVLKKYRAAWSFLDRIPDEVETIHGYMQSLVTEELMSKMHVECREIVDELMREELKLLLKEQQKMYKRFGWRFPKIKTKKAVQKTAKPLPRPIDIDQSLLSKLAPLFDVDQSITKPKTKLKDVYGDYNYNAYNHLIEDPDAKFLPPAYGDVKNRLILSCILGSGVQPGADRKKSVMLLGPENFGKSFLIDAVAGEINAVKINLSPDMYVSQFLEPGEICNLVFLAAKVFQPTVIYMRNIEKVFAKTVPNEDLNIRASAYIKPLKKLLKMIEPKDVIIFIATCSNPATAKSRPMLSLFDETILIPRADYGSVSRFFQEKFQRIRSMPCCHFTLPYANMLKNFGFGTIVRLYNQVMTPERTIKLNITPLSPTEFLDIVLKENLKPVSDEEYKHYEHFFLKSTSLHKKRIQFALINEKRRNAYAAIAKKADEENAKKRKKKEIEEEEGFYYDEQPPYF